MTVKDIIQNAAGQLGCKTSILKRYPLREEYGKVCTSLPQIYKNKQERTAAPLGPQFGLAQRVRQVPCSRKHDDLPNLQHKIEIESCFDFFLEHCQWVCSANFAAAVPGICALCADRANQKTRRSFSGKCRYSNICNGMQRGKHFEARQIIWRTVTVAIC